MTEERDGAPMTSSTVAGIDLMELASCVEAASGPDRELDAMIRCAVFAPAAAYVKQSPFNGAWCIYELGYNGKERSWEARGVSHLQRVGEFTASLDAAMTLVPEGWQIGLGDYASDGDDGWKTGEGWHARLIPREPDDEVSGFNLSSPALALTAAALRARASLIEEERS